MLPSATSTRENVPGWTLAQRRDFMKLPLAERRRRLESQAEQMMAEYESETESSLRAEWQGGDIVEF